MTTICNKPQLVKAESFVCGFLLQPNSYAVENILSAAASSFNFNISFKSHPN